MFLTAGETEVPLIFVNQGEERRVRVDCQTESHVYEVGLDQTSSARDSIHQAVFASILSGKRPFVVLIDRDGVEGRYEQEMRSVADLLDISYANCDAGFLIRWAETAGVRSAALSSDRPLPEAFARRCRVWEADGGFDEGALFDANKLSE
jgi:hypothetical protein